MRGDDAPEATPRGEIPMGLDQYAFATPPAPLMACDDPAFVRRKHARLQERAEALLEARTGEPRDALNCGEL